MQLTLYTDYSLRILIYLSRMPTESASVAEIASFYNISRNHLVKVALRLSKLGYVEATRGKGGGMKLARAPEKILIGEVIRHTEPNFFLVECFNEAENQCVITGNCHLKRILHQGMQAFLAQVDVYTLAHASPPALTQKIAAALKKTKAA